MPLICKICPDLQNLFQNIVSILLWDTFLSLWELYSDLELFHLPTLMHDSLFINKCMLHYYPRHVLSINMPIFRRTNCIHTASGIVALCKRLHSKPVESGLLCSLLLCIKVGKLNNSILWCTVEKNIKLDKCLVYMFSRVPSAAHGSCGVSRRLWR